MFSEEGAVLIGISCIIYTSTYEPESMPRFVNALVLQSDPPKATYVLYCHGLGLHACSARGIVLEVPPGLPVFSEGKKGKKAKSALPRPPLTQCGIVRV